MEAEVTDEAGARGDPGWHDREMERMRKESALELQAVREELAEAERELEAKEAAPLDHRVTDDVLYQVSLRQLRRRVENLRADEEALAEAEE